MNNWLTFMPDHFVNALGWMIFHSIWQGLIIGLIVSLIYKCCRNISPQARYLVGVFALASIFTLSLFTFMIAYQPVPSPDDSVIHPSYIISSPAGSPQWADEWPDVNPLLSGWQQYFTGAFELVSIIWLVGVLLLSLRLAGGMLVISGMRRQGVAPLPAAWEQRLQRLAVKTGLHRSLTYLQSRKVSVPVVIGILRPVVLIPAMIISGLPADQIEAIMVHELAHIRRHDFLINMLQSIMEALFFYHPVVWIISENIRREREKCCDDFTVRFCGQVVPYARALACLSVMQINAAIPSVAITGNKKNIIHRVERLINKKKMKTNGTERLVSGLVLVTSVLIMVLGTGATLKPARFAQMESQIMLPYTVKRSADTVPLPEPVAEPFSMRPINPPPLTAGALMPLPIPPPVPVSLPLPASPPAPAVLPDTSDRYDHINMDIKDNVVTREFHDKEGKDHEMKLLIRQGKVNELYVDGKKIPENEFPSYQDEIDVTLKDLREMEEDIKHARSELEDIDFDKIAEDIRIDLERFREEDMKKLHEEMMKAREEMQRAIEEHRDGAYKLDEEEFRKAMEMMEKNLAEARENMAMIDEEQIRERMDEAVKSIQDIDYEKIRQEIESAIREITKIDVAAIEKDIQDALRHIDKEKLDMGQEKRNMDDMIEELEKLELDKK
jgi:beta-lactamase regulating signal transducer with metallopeptidase domain